MRNTAVRKALSVLGWRPRGAECAAPAAAQPTSSTDAWEDEVHPWLAGAVEWSERYGSLLAEARRWRLHSLVQMGINLVAIGGLVALAIVVMETKYGLYVVQVDKHGYAIPIKPAERASMPSEKERIEAVSEWLISLRTVFDSVDAQYFLVNKAYARMAKDTPAWREATEWFAANNPMLTSKRIVKVEVLSVFSMNDPIHMTIEWIEREQSPGTAMKSARFRANVKLAYSPARLLKDIVENGSGIYIADYSITQLENAE